MNDSTKSEKENPAAAPVPAKPSPPPNIGREIDLFINQIDALAETLPLSTIAINQVSFGAGQELRDFLSKECKAQQKEDREQSRKDKKRIQELERELRRKDKALAETAALLVLRKKLNDYWGTDNEDN